MNDFRDALGRFRDAMRQEGERAENPGLQSILERERSTKGVRSQWTMVAWAAAAVVVLALGAIPAYENAQRRREADQEKADSLLMEQVNAGLSRSVARAMTPLMDWAPGN